MKNVEYIIVGDGFAGLFFAHQLIKNNRSFVLYSKGEKSASRISAGMVNPVVLKKFTTFDNAHIQINQLRESLNEIENYTTKKILVEEEIHRIFHDEKEKQTWTKKSENESLKNFLQQEFIDINDINNPFGSGVVKHSFRVDIPTLFDSFFHYLEQKNQLIKEEFDYSLINTEANTYKNIAFSNIIFAEGIEVRKNPFFSQIPIITNKGHHLTLNIQDFKEKRTLKKKHFLIPLNDTEYYYGGTYDRENETLQVDDSAVAQLEKGLKEILLTPYNINSVEYAFRPTTKDRKPILGRHHTQDNLYIFNGLGARGLLNGAFYAKVLFEHIEHGKALPQEVLLERENIQPK